VAERAPTSLQARPTTRDSQALGARFAKLSPATLATVLLSAERGEIRDFVDLCDRMIQIDADVRVSYEARLAAVSGARHVVQPGTPTGDPARDAYAAAAAQLVERQLEGLDVPQRAHESLDAIGKGFAAHQIDWQWRDETWVAASLEWVHQRRFKWSRDWQLLLVDDGENYSAGEPLDEDLWIVHAPKTIAGYPGVTGVLRAVCWPYLFKRWGQQFWVQGAESFAWPFLFAKVPRNAPREVRAKALEGLEALSADHRAVVEDPAAFELIETTVKDGGTWRDLHNAMTAEITKAVLGMTDATTATRIGAYAAVETRAGMTVDSRIAMDERALASTWRSQLIERIVRLNAHLFGGLIPPIPHVRWQVASTRREVPQHLMQVATVNELRSSLDLPPRAEGDRLFVDGASATPALPSVAPGEAKSATDEVVDEAAAAGDVAGLGLSGAQIKELKQLVIDVASGTLPREAALGIIAVAFPTVSAEAASKMLPPPSFTPAPPVQEANA